MHGLPRAVKHLRHPRGCPHLPAAVQHLWGPRGCPHLPAAVQQLQGQRRYTHLPGAVQQVHHANDEWMGLTKWRGKGVDRGWWWGEKGPCHEPSFGSAPYQSVALPNSLLECGLLVLSTADPCGKSALTHRAWEAYNNGTIPLGAAQKLTPAHRPARPDKPELLSPRQVPSFKASPLPLNAHVLHNLAHIELNAIDLAWDTAVRFADLNLNPGFYEDFVRVADDESRHLGWCLQRLHELDHAYGDMPAHDLLWQGAQMSAHDLNARLAMVPMTQEARGLDAGERLATRLVGWGDNRSAAIVKRIAEEEKAHVAVGVTWFRRVCAALSIEEGPTFRQWIQQLAPEVLKGPFNHAARQEVGLSQDWYDPQQWPAAQPANSTAAETTVKATTTAATSPVPVDALLLSAAPQSSLLHAKPYDDATQSVKSDLGNVSCSHVDDESSATDPQKHADSDVLLAGCVDVGNVPSESNVSPDRLRAVKQQLAGMLELEGAAVPADT